MAQEPHILLAFRPSSRRFSTVTVETPTHTTHLAYGLWAALGVILLLPSPKRSHQRLPTEDELLRSYGLAITAFSYL